MRKFPCWVCKGKGSWVESVLDDGSGPNYECGFCEGHGLIEVNSPLHSKIKHESIAMQALLKFGQDKQVSWVDLMQLGKDIEQLTLNVKESK